jgi:mono/diheme cytochrome c family protein
VLRLACFVAVVVALFSPSALRSQPAAAPGDITFAKDIAPILQRSCQQCHRSNGVAPMSLVSYEEVRPWARAIKEKTLIGPHGGVMPPWFVEKEIGIQKFKNDPSLTDDEIAKIVKWTNSGAPPGNPADMPPPLSFDDSDKWTIGEPDLVLTSKEMTVPASPRTATCPRLKSER